AAAGKRPPTVFAFVAHEPDDAGRLAVETSPEADDLVVSRVRFGEPDRRLDRFGTARIELGAIELSGRHLGEALQELESVLGREAADGDLADLRLHHRDPARMRMAEGRHRHAREEI